MKRLLLLSLLFVGTALAGPPLVCLDFESDPTSLFAHTVPLGMVTVESDDNPASAKAAAAKIETLRKRALSDPNNFNAQVEAGYLIQAMNQMWRKHDPDGLRFLAQALKLAPQSAELHLILSLAFAGEDQAKSTAHWFEAKRLAQPGSTAEKNLARVKQKLGIT